MVVSELIAQLQLALARYGDLQVLQDADGDVADIDAVRVFSIDTAEPVVLIGRQSSSL